MFYTAKPMFPKKAAFLKALLFAGWAPNPRASSTVDDLLVLEKDRYQMIIAKRGSIKFKAPNGSSHKIITTFQLGAIKFDPKQYYTITIKNSEYATLTINLLKPATFVHGPTFDLTKTLKTCRGFLLQYAKENGQFPSMWIFKEWIQKRFHVSYKVATFIHQQGRSAYWVERKPISGHGKRVAPIHESEVRRHAVNPTSN